MKIDLRKLHILVVEDILPMQQLIMEMLTALGVGTVSVAENGRSGYNLYTKKNLI